MRISYDRYIASYCALFIFNQIFTVLGKVIGYSSVVTTVIMLLLGIPTIFFAKRASYAGLLLILFCFILIALSFLIHPVPLEYIFRMFAFLILPIYIFSNGVNFELVFRYIKPLAIVNFLLLLYIVILRQDIFYNKELMNYMSFGFWLLPSAIYFAISFYEKKSSLSFFILFTSFLVIFLFANRSSTVILLFTLISLNIIYKGFGVKDAIYYIITFVIFSIFYIFASDILSMLIDLAHGLDLEPITLIRLQNSLGSTDVNELSSGRFDLYYFAIDLIIDNPWGYGLFYSNHLIYVMTNYTAAYPHSILIDFILHYGVVLGFFLLLSLFYFSFKEVQNKNSLFLLVLFVSLKLFFSSVYYVEPAFSVLVCILFNSRYKVK